MEVVWHSISQVKDYIIDYGTSGVWRYAKFASGLAICTCVATGSVSHYSGVYADWFYGFTGSLAYPFKFAEIPATTFAVRIGSGFAAHCNVSNDMDYLTWVALSNVSGNTTYVIEGIAIGRWK